MGKNAEIKELFIKKYERYKRFARLPMWGAVLSLAALFIVFLRGSRSYTISFTPIIFFTNLLASNNVVGVNNQLITLIIGIIYSLAVGAVGYYCFKGKLWALIVSAIYYIFDTVMFFFADFEMINADIYDFMFGCFFRIGVIIMIAIAAIYFYDIARLYNSRKNKK